MSDRKWYEIDAVENIHSPALVIYPDRIENNIRLMIEMAGGTKFLRPHIKTHKIAEIVEMQMQYGITKFKCATIAEADLLAKCRVTDVLLAMQPVGIQIHRFINLISKYPNTNFSTIVDNEKIIDDIETIAKDKKAVVSLWLDINNGMNRTGVLPNNDAVYLYQKINIQANLIAKGLHVYDGHIHEPDFVLRKEATDKAFDPVLQLINKIKALGIKIETIVAGGTPTFPIHIKRKNVEVSPGTPLLWDQGYADNYKDLKFLPAAVLLGTIISTPRSNLICLNLGHKSVAAEMSFPRVKILNFEDCKQISHSEEHLVIECKSVKNHTVGAVCYAIPTHICPTVIKYKEVLIVKDKKIVGSWKVAARDHEISV